MRKTTKKPAAAKARKPRAPRKTVSGARKTKAKVISLKAKARRAPQKRAEKKAAPPLSPGQVIRKLLELKEARRKQAAENRPHHQWKKPLRYMEDRNHNVAKFAGPRRRAV